MKIKDRYGGDYARFLAEKIKTVFADFKGRSFVSYIETHTRDKEFLARMDVFVDAFNGYLPNTYTENLQLFSSLWGDELKQETGMFTEGGWLWPIGKYVERHGLEDVKHSIAFIKELTKRFTGEFAVRPLLAHQAKTTMKTLLKWSKDENVHVRRLSSEGARIRLPWAKKCYTAIDEFETYKKILTNLKNDSSKFVQKSVGNNLNDLYKEFPQKANEIISEWQKENITQETAWIIKRGQRNLNLL